MLRWRLLLGAACIGSVAGLCWLDARSTVPGLWLFPLAAAISIGASGEIMWMLAARGLRPLPWVVYVGNLLIVSANWLPQSAIGGADVEQFVWPVSALVVAVIAAFVGEMWRFTGPGQTTERLATAVFSLIYVGILESFLVQSRFLGKGAWGIAALASLIIVVKMCDTGAYTVGRLVGRHKLAPVLSPGKTVEGVLGGLVFACIGAWLAFVWIVPALVPPSKPSTPWPAWLAYGLLIGLTSVAGDLAESLLKRDLGRKDSSAWMPGFGGVLDIMDSILLAGPAGYLAWRIGLV